jgi:hypothetical protein
MSPLIWMKIIIVYSYPLITLIGLITNSVSFVIFSRKRFKNTIFSTYMSCFILCQSLNLILPLNKLLELNFNIYFSRLSNFCCKIRNIYPHFNLANSVWLLVVISFDRYLSISHPSRFLIRKKFSFQIITCFCVIIFNMCALSPTWLYHLKYQYLYVNSTNRTDVVMVSRCVTPGIWLETYEMLHVSINPFFFMILFTLLTLKNVFKSRNKINSSSKQTINNDRHFAISSIATNVLFLILNFPHFFLMIINDDYTRLFVNSKDLLLFLQTTFLFLLYMNFISTFLVNYFLNSIFKSELEKFLVRNQIILTGNKETKSKFRTSSKFP